MTDSYSTPSWLMGLFEDWFDPCPLADDWAENGLEIDWGSRTYCNPPYSNPMPWVKKAIAESKKGKLVVMLLRVDTSTRWFAALVEANAEILWFSRRLKFTDKAANFPSMLVILTQERNK